jgi:DnaD/phage-associated family protein
LTEKDDATARVFDLFQDNIHPITGQIETDILTELLDHYGENWTTEAIKEAALNHGTSVKYIESILKAWERNGFKAPKERSRKNNGRRLQGAYQQDRGPQESESAKRLAADLDYYESHQVYPWEVQSAGAGAGGEQKPDSGD